jgi:hypothetical protein
VTDLVISCARLRRCMFVLKASLCIATIAICFSALSAAQLSVSCQQRTVAANVLNRHGVPVTGLGAKDFRATSRGRPVTILSAQRIEIPARIVILLDTSSSMRGRPLLQSPRSDKFQIAEAAVRDLISVASTESPLSFMSFADKIEDRIDFSDGRPAVVRWLNSETSVGTKPLRGRTVLFDAIRAALQQFGHRQVGDSVLVITDGADAISRTTASQIAPMLRDLGVRLFAFLLDDSNRTMEERAGRDALSELVRNSGGFMATFAPNVAVPMYPGLAYLYNDKAQTFVKEDMAILNAQVSGFYVLKLELPKPTSGPEKWKLKAVDVKGRNRKDITLTYPQKLASCSAESNRP